MIVLGVLALCFYLPSSASSNVLGDKFLPGSGQFKNEHIITITKLKSELDCGGQCLKRMGCKSFAVNGSTCVQFSDDSGLFKIDCPTCRGYSKHTLCGKEHCLRYVSTKTSWIAAQAECASAGAHHVLIKSRQMLDDLESLLLKWNHGTALLCVDGKDLNNDNNLLTWAGNALPFTDWVPGEPKGGDCLYIGYSGSQYKMDDYVCNLANYQYVCEL